MSNGGPPPCNNEQQSLDQCDSMIAYTESQIVAHEASIASLNITLQDLQDLRVMLQEALDQCLAGQ